MICLPPAPAQSDSFPFAIFRDGTAACGGGNMLQSTLLHGTLADCAHHAGNLPTFWCETASVLCAKLVGRINGTIEGEGGGDGGGGEEQQQINKTATMATMEISIIHQSETNTHQQSPISSHQIYRTMGFVEIEAWSSIRLSASSKRAIGFDPNTELDWRNQASLLLLLLAIWKKS